MLGTAGFNVMFDSTAGCMVSYWWMTQPDICMAQLDIWWDGTAGYMHGTAGYMVGGPCDY